MILKLISAASPTFREVADLTEPGKLVYGYRWNIPVEFPIYHGCHEDHGWGRIDFMQDHLRSCDWLLWTGADTLIVNQTIDPRSFIDESFDLITALDINGLQSDVLFLRNCTAVRKLLEDTRAARSTDFHLPWLAGTEQGAMVRILSGLPRYINALPISELQFGGVRVKEAPKSINRYIDDFQVGDWIFHAAGMSIPEKVKWIKAFNKQVIS